MWVGKGESDGVSLAPLGSKKETRDKMCLFQAYRRANRRISCYLRYNIATYLPVEENWYDTDCLEASPGL